MQKHGTIIVNAYAPTTLTRQVRRMTEELERLGTTADVLRNDNFIARLSSGEITLEGSRDFCLYLDKDKYVCRMLERMGVRVFNTANAIELCDDKMLTHIALAGSGIPMPDTLPGLLCYDRFAPVNRAALDKAVRLLGLPMIVKQSFGSLGKGVFLAGSMDELIDVAEKLKLEPHLFQKYIAASRGRDMRVIVVGGEVLGGIIRSSPVDFRSNIGLGGKAEPTAVPDDIRNYAERAATILGLDYCGIDFLLGDHPYLCEVNSNAYFDAFEQATGINVAAAYALLLLGKK